jgi:hypothetical protein
VPRTPSHPPEPRHRRAAEVREGQVEQDGAGYAKAFKSGKALCSSYQVGKCQGKSCPKTQGDHLCGKILQTGYACGQKHCGKDCKRT